MARPLVSSQNRIALLKGYRNEPVPGILDKKGSLEIFHDPTRGSFYPAIRVRGWDGLGHFRIDLQQAGENFTGRSPILDRFNNQDRVLIDAGHIKHRLFAHALKDRDDDNQVEWDIILPAKPASNRFRFRISSEGLIFAKQGRLTQEEIDDRLFRPVHIVNSIAVFYEKSNNRHWSDGQQHNFKTGKLCHIYRPRVVDALGKKTWGNIDVISGFLVITVPQPFLDAATYPVTIDPPIGFTDVGGTQHGVGTNRAHGHATTALIYTAGSNEQVEEMWGYWDASSGTRSAGQAIYTITGASPNNGSLGTRLGAVSTHNAINSATPAWYGVTGLSIAMTNGITYTIAWGEYSSNTISDYLDTVPANRRRQDNTTLGATWTNGGVSDVRASMYFVFNSVSGHPDLVANTGTFSLAGTATGLAAGRQLATVVGAFALAGTATGLIHGRTLSLTVGALTLSGIAAALKASRKLAPVSEGFTLAGIAVALSAGRQIAPATGVFTLTGIDVTLTYVPVGGAFTLVMDLGTFALVGPATGLAAGRMIAPAVGVFTLAGIATNLVHGRTLPAQLGTFAISGTDTALVAARQLPLTVGAFTLTGNAAGLAATRQLTADPGSFTLSGTATGLAAARQLAVTTGVYVLTGIDIALIVPGDQQFEELLITNVVIKTSDIASLAILTGDITGLLVKVSDIDDFTLN